RKGRCESRLGQSESDVSRLRGRHALCRIDHPFQARIEESPWPGDCDRFYSGRKPGRQGSNELRTHDVDLQAWSLSGRGGELLNPVRLAGHESFVLAGPTG